MNNFTTTSIRFTSRASVKIKDSYYTFEASIEKQCPPEIAKDITDNEYEEVKEKLWAECNEEVDKQIEETYNFLTKNH